MVRAVQKFRSPNLDEYWISENIFVSEDMNHPDFEDASLATCRLPKGERTQLHSLSVDEVYIIKSGKGLLTKGDVAPFSVAPGDCIHIPMGVCQNIKNTGDADLVFQTLCMPRFTHDSYTSLEG